MSNRAEIISSMDDIWEKIEPKAREDWAIHQAAHDTKIQAIFGVFALHDFEAATIDLVKDGLEDMLERDYGVPPERSHEVFGKAEALVWQEMEANG